MILFKETKTKLEPADYFMAAVSIQVEYITTYMITNQTRQITLITEQTND